MEDSFSAKCVCPFIIIILITLDIIVPVLYMCLTWLNLSNDFQNEIWLMGSAFTLWITQTILEIAINALLLYLYVRTLHRFAMHGYFNYKVAKDDANRHGDLLDDRQHELMLEATRYTVSFSVVLIANLIGIVCSIRTRRTFATSRLLFCIQFKRPWHSKYNKRS